jgi:hypothetical protein
MRGAIGSDRRIANGGAAAANPIIQLGWFQVSKVSEVSGRPIPNEIPVPNDVEHTAPRLSSLSRAVNALSIVDVMPPPPLRSFHFNSVGIMLDLPVRNGKF